MMGKKEENGENARMEMGKMKKRRIAGFPQDGISGAKRANIRQSCCMIEGEDWFVGFGKDESCMFEGTWWDMICFARNVLASENTKLCAPEYYHPKMKNENYLGEQCPYLMVRDRND